MKRFLFSRVLLMIVCLGFITEPRTSSSAQSATLKLNQPLTRAIKAGETQEFQLALKAGEFAQVEAIQKGVDVVLKLYSPGGELLLEHDSPNGADGPELLSCLADAAGTYKLAVSVWGLTEVKEGSYTIELKALRQSTPQDRQRIAAETLFREAATLGEKAQVLRFARIIPVGPLSGVAAVLFEKAQALSDEEKADDPEKLSAQSRAKYQESLTLWRELDDKYWVALTLQAINSGESLAEAAKIHEELGNKKHALQLWVEIYGHSVRSRGWQQARASCEKAMALAKEINDAGEIAHIQHYLAYSTANLLLDEAQRLSSAGKTIDALAALDQAIAETQKVVSLTSVTITALNQLGQIYLDLGDLEKAQENYQKAFQLARTSDDSWGVAASSLNFERVKRKHNAKSLMAELVVQTGHTNAINSVAFAPDGRTLASGSVDNTIKLWDVVTGTELRSLRGHTDDINSVAFTPDGRMLASCSSDGTIKLWHVTTGTELRTLHWYTNPITSVGTGLRPIPWLTNVITSVAFAPDGRTLASGSYDKIIKLWNVVTGTELRTLSGHTLEVTSVAFAPDGRTLASCSKDGTIKLWDVMTGNDLRTLSGHTLGVTSVAFAPDGRTLASGGVGGTIKLWDVTTGMELRTINGQNVLDPTKFGGGRDVQVYSVAFSPDGRTLASGSNLEFGTIKLWDVTTGTELRTVSSDTSWTKSIAFAPDGRTLAGGNIGNTIKLWDVATGTELRTLRGHAHEVGSVAVAPDGRTLGNKSSDDTIKLWGLATGGGLRTLRGGNFGSIDFSPDGRTLASVYVPSSIAFVPNSRTLASASKDVTIKLWDVTTAAALPAPNTLPEWAKFSRDWHAVKTINGKSILIATDGGRGQINLINYDTGERLGSLIALDKDDWAVVTPDGLFDASPGAMKLMHFVISGIEEGYAIVAFDQMQERYYQPGLLAKLLGFDNTPIKQAPPFTGDKLYPKVEFRWQANNSTKLEIKLKNRGGGIGEVSVLINGNTWLKDVRPPGFDKNAKETTFIVDLRDAPFLVGAPDQVEVVARNAEGWLTSARGSTIIYDVETETAKPNPELWAIIGGVSDYEGTQLDLNFAAKDAEDFANAIKLGGYRLFGAERVHLQLLTTNSQDPKLLPTKDNFRRVFSEFQRAKPNDVLLVYLSGHGVAFRLDGDRVVYSYLTQTATSGDLKDSDVRNRDAITSDELMDWIRSIKTNKNVLLFDTCAAGAFADNLNLAIKKDDAGEYADNQKRALSQLRQRVAFHILMGSAANKPSYETSQFNQGLLTRALLEGIQYGAVNRDRVVNVNELFQFARKRVEELAESIGNRYIQTPQLSSPEGDNLPLLLMSQEDAAAIRLEQARPFVMRPRLVNLDNRRDLEIEKRLIQRLRAFNQLGQPGQRGAAGRTALLIYLEDVELPIAITPNGDYKYEGEQITVNLDLLRNDQTVGTLTIVGARNDLNGLVEKIIAELGVALGKLPRYVAEPPK